MTTTLITKLLTNPLAQLRLTADSGYQSPASGPDHLTGRLSMVWKEPGGRTWAQSGPNVRDFTVRQPVKADAPEDPSDRARSKVQDRWVEIGLIHFDPGFALWAWCQVQLDRTALPVDRVVVAFVFNDQPRGNQRFWLLVENGAAQVCYSDPGGEPAVSVHAESAAFIDWHRGRLSWNQALRSGRIEVYGDRRVAAQLPNWNLHESTTMTPA